MNQVANPRTTASVFDVLHLLQLLAVCNIVIMSRKDLKQNSLGSIDSGSIRDRFGIDSGSIRDRFGIDQGSIRIVSKRIPPSKLTVQ